jgi:prepilin-type N-terminal cleavage/methylation domain-containing protein
MRAIKGARRGFTLIEIMVVVAIIGALIGALYANLKVSPQVIDVANRVGDIAHEANREAVAFGNVRADVVTNLGSKARTRLVAYGTTDITFELQRLQEHVGDSGADWIVVTSYTTNAAWTTCSYWAPSVGSYATVSGVASSTWGASSASPTFITPCYPDGTCDGRTLFFQAVHPDGLDDKARLSIMPLGGSTYTRKDWN